MRRARATTNVSRWVLALTATAWFGCSNDLDIEPDDDETDIAEISKPKKAPPGSFGGICGKRFSECTNTQTMVDRFTNLRRTSISVSSEAKGSGFTERRKVSVRMRVPRLVDDHRDKYDQLEMILVFSEFDADSQQHRSEVAIKRNSVIVGNFSSVSFEPDRSEVRVDLGGWETLMAFTTNGGLMKRLFSELQLTSVTKRAPGGNLGCGFSTGGHCAWCWTGKGLLIAGIAAAGGSLAIALELASDAIVGGVIAGAGSAATLVVDKAISCDKQCNRAKCEDDYCKCGGARSCEDDFEVCCGAAGGITRFRGNTYRCLEFDGL